MKEQEDKVNNPKINKQELPIFEVLAIFISPTKGAPMEDRDFVTAIAGAGLEGDRYAQNVGAFSGTKRIPDSDRQVTLISRQGIDEANVTLLAQGNQIFEESETRRNLVMDISTDGLNALVGKHFRIGEVEMEGVEVCTPCARPANLAKKAHFDRAFENKGGLRARILNNGIISKNK